MTRQRRLAFVALALIVTGSYGWRSNDEADQSAAFLSLSQGSLHVEEVSPRAYALSENVSWWRRWDDTPVASTALNVLALPMAAVVLLADWIAPLSVVLSATAAGLAVSLAGGTFPALQRFLDPRRRLVVAGMLTLALSKGLRAEWLDVQYYYPTVVLQMTNMVLAVVGAELLWIVLLRSGAPATPRTVLWLGVVLGPWLHWGTALKYHMLAAVVVVAIIFLLQQQRHRPLLLGALAGFGYWVNPMVGLGCMGALGLTWMARHRTRRHAAFLATGVLLGAAPGFLENAWLFGNPLTGFYQAGGGFDYNMTGNDTAQPSLIESVLHWHGPKDFALNLASILLDGRRVEGYAFGLLWVTPILGAGLLVGRKSLRQESVTFTVALLAIQAVVMTNAGIRQGFGDDVRLWFHVLPALAVLAAHGLAHMHLADNASRRPLFVGPLLASAYIGALVVAGSWGWTVGVGGTDFRLVYEVGLVLAVAAAALIWLLSTQGRIQRQQSMTAMLSLLLVAPLMWTVLAQVVEAPDIPRTGDHEGGSTFLPFLHPVFDAIQDGLNPPSPLPIVYDANGTLVFHPDYGLCIRTPSPCPESVRASLQREPIDVEALFGEGTP